MNDPAVVVTFPLLDEPETAFVAWTTTPWTLPSNLALCVHPEMDYIKIKEKESGSQFWIMEARTSQLVRPHPPACSTRLRHSLCLLSGCVR